MANDRQYDSLEWSQLNFPYDTIERELSEKPRLVSGLNTYVTVGGKLIKRYGTIKVDPTINTVLNLRIDRLWLVETLDTPVIVYIVASAFDSGAGTWGLYYIRLDAGGSPVWTSAGTLRQVHSSTRPHEATVSRGLLYVKGYPSGGSGEKLGSVIFDGTAGSVSLKYWGLLGPTTPAAITGVVNAINQPTTGISASQTTFNVVSGAGFPSTPFNAQIDFELMTVTAVATNTFTVLRGAQGTVPAPHADKSIVIYRDWAASTNAGVVNMFWEYSYAYESLTGQVSNRAPLETNPATNPSLTGPFFNLIPKITVQGLADTTNVPFIRIYRTTDGGGTLQQVGRIANTGAGAITYIDNGGASGDPTPDSSLNSQAFAPSLTSNGPPATVLAPLVVGTDTPQASTPPVTYAARLWMAIGNVVFFSANEELNVGIPEESWPSGTFGNFFRFPNPVVGMIPTNTALYVITTKNTYQLTGTNLETFNPQPILSSIGGAIGHPMAYTTYGNAAVWLTNDLRVAVLEGQNFKTISDPLGLDLINAINAGALMDIKYWAEMEKEHIVVTALAPTSSNTRTWMYDINKSSSMQMDFWNTPWTISASAVASGRIRETQQQPRLMFNTWNGSNGFLTRWTTNANDAVGTDDLPGALGSPFDFTFNTGLFQVPPGDHVNMLRRPGLTPILWGFIAERTVFGNEPDPTAFYFLNDTWTTPLPPAPPHGPARDDPPKGYKTLIYSIATKGRRVAFQLNKLGSVDRFELQNLALVFNSDSGAGQL